MSEKKRKRGYIETWNGFECDEEHYDRMLEWMCSNAKRAFEHSNKGPVVIRVYDEDGHDAGRNEVSNQRVGSPSAELRRMAEEADASFSEAI